LFWLMQAFFAGVGCLVLHQVAMQLVAWLFGAPFLADDYFGAGSLSVERLEYTDGSHQVFKTSNSGCGQPWYQLGHFVPAAVWAVLLPLQVTATARKAWPVAHRWGGRAFMVCSALLGSSALVFPACGHSFSGKLDAPLSVLSLVFLATGWMAYRAAADRRFRDHHAWVARHLGSGLGIYAMRVIYVMAFAAVYPDPTAVEKEALVRGRQDLFGWSGIAGVALSLAAAEAYVRLVVLRPARSKSE